MVTKKDCVEGLQEAADILGRSPSRPEYRKLDVGPSVTSLKKYLGGNWNSAKREAGLSAKGVGGSISFNHEYFSEIDTREKSYWLGMLYGDGCLCEPATGNPRLSLALQEKEHVVEFQQAINSKHKLTEDGGVWRFGVRNREFTNDLRSHGLTPEKTHSAILPDLFEDGKRASFVRGLFDADGHVGEAGRFNITGSSYGRFRTLLAWLPVDGSIVDRGDGAFTLRVGGVEMLATLYGWLYPEGKKTRPKLKRKYEDVRQYRR